MKENHKCKVCSKNDIVLVSLQKLETFKYSSICQTCIDDGYRIKDIYAEKYEYERSITNV